MYNEVRLKDAYDRYIKYQYEVDLELKTRGRNTFLSDVIFEITTYMSSYIKDTIGQACDVSIKYDKSGVYTTQKILITSVRININEYRYIVCDMESETYVYSGIDSDTALLLYESCEVLLYKINTVYYEIMAKYKISGLYYIKKTLLHQFDEYINAFNIHLERIKESDHNEIEGLILQSSFMEQGHKREIEYEIEGLVYDLLQDHGLQYTVEISCLLPLTFAYVAYKDELPLMYFSKLVFHSKYNELSTKYTLKWNNNILTHDKIDVSPISENIMRSIIGMLDTIAKILDRKIVTSVKL